MGNTASMSPDEGNAYLKSLVEDFLAGPENDLRMPGGLEPAWGVPLIGFAAGDDPLWNRYKEVVGKLHWTPAEAFSKGHPAETAAPSELSVLSWVLPQTAATRDDNRKERSLPAERWARSRIFGEGVNVALRQHVVASLAKQGVQAVAPSILPQWKRVTSETYGFSSTWSERHAAHAAGLGTFGLCDGLITPVGKSMRVGSVVLRMQLQPTERPYGNHREYCLHFSKGKCGACIKRCPVGAISEKGHDKLKCRAHIHETARVYVEATWGFKGYGCGMCQVGVPCEKGIPGKSKRGDA
jgi:ferredoxin